METVKYILDFFFGPDCGWHFLGLCVLFLCIGHKSNNPTINLFEKEDKKGEEE